MAPALYTPAQGRRGANITRPEVSGQAICFAPPPRATHKAHLQVPEFNPFGCGTAALGNSCSMALFVIGRMDGSAKGYIVEGDE